jgi:hypothetical protein
VGCKFHTLKVNAAISSGKWSLRRCRKGGGRFEKATKRLGLEINDDKTKFMVNKPSKQNSP